MLAVRQADFRVRACQLDLVQHVGSRHCRRRPCCPPKESANQKWTRLAFLFPNETSLFQMASAVYEDVGDDYETERL